MKKYIFLILILSINLYSDTIRKTDGTTITDVKVIACGDKLRYIEKNGKSGSLQHSEYTKIDHGKVKGLDDKWNNKEMKERKAKIETCNDELDEKLKKLETEKKKVEKNNQKKIGVEWGNVWRSAVLPGWGQFRNQNYIRGGLYMILFLGAGYAVYRTNEKIDEKIDEQKNECIAYIAYLSYPCFVTESSKKEITKGERKRRENLYIGAGVIWLISIFDAVVSDPPEPKRSSWNFDINYQPIFQAATSTKYEPVVNVRYTWRF